jgi:hypothetical protein
VKLYLDMATSLLILAERYVPGYAARADALCELAADRPLLVRDIDLADLAAQVARCTAWKLRPGPCPCDAAPRDFAIKALRLASCLWHCELRQLTGCGEQTKDSELMARWMESQPLGDRLRGWLYVARACGWLRAVHRWPRWARLAVHGSPRYRIYAVAGELAQAVVNGEEQAAEDWICRLPLSDEHRDAISALARNYHILLKDTRA